ncbi:gluconate 2-dehydrogenase subunit 3 family protein [Sphingobium yanoikuyae]|uniref:Gluconate 2-dehydrogenase subunit 3 family protein n=2 Tax=Sphingobium TaxID=165695 RepID=A0A291N0M3_SPHYA|nr:gluconate 2-dehydrogenase subunit 3 family protein [Sphingobium yanoikuyae]ATI80876.1 transcriptional initiation protein Tat [Sphingobium yanoikuyae]QHD67717.1 gluconate 2-dehydrogenase subunit 3 family protein [Sphingobium yanoikuyae]
MDRRAALASIVGVLGANIFAPLARAIAYQPNPVINTGAPEIIFTPAQRALVTALSERILPTSDTPGAIAAGVPEYIEHMLGDWAITDERATIFDGLAAIDARSLADYKKPAVKASAAQQDALLTLAMNGELPGGTPFFEAFRQLVITGYYTSEIGITQEREYLPVPGEYDGAYPYAKVKRIFSS